MLHLIYTLKLSIFRAELWWKYLDSENVWAPPPFTVIDLLERSISRLRLEMKHKEYYNRQQTEDPSSIPTQQHLQINHQTEIRNEFLSKYKELLLMLLASIEEVRFRNNSNPKYETEDAKENEEEDVLAGVEAGAE